MWHHHLIQVLIRLSSAVTLKPTDLEQLLFELKLGPLRVGEAAGRTKWICQSLVARMKTTKPLQLVQLHVYRPHLTVYVLYGIYNGTVIQYNRLQGCLLACLSRIWRPDHIFH